MIDEAETRLRLEMNAVPENLAEVEIKIRELKIGREALKRK
ncbi:MAG: ATP-dependent Clp protease ATP-binding subunit ClpA [Saprospiraceae bacterium]